MEVKVRKDMESFGFLKWNYIVTLDDEEEKILHGKINSIAELIRANKLGLEEFSKALRIEDENQAKRLLKLLSYDPSSRSYEYGVQDTIAYIIKANLSLTMIDKGDKYGDQVRSKNS